MRRALPFLFGLAFVPAGSACTSASCGEGFVDLGGRCVDPNAPGDCGTCDAHEICNVSVTPNACACAPGYQGVPCVWSGVVFDPGFVGEEDPSTGDPYWVDEGGKGAVVLPLAPGIKNLGEGALTPSVVCNAGGLTQALQMPSYETAEPLVAEVTYQAQGVHGLAVGFDRAWKRLPATGGDWQSESFCLGEAAYGPAPRGGTVTVRLSASERLADCFGDDPQGRIRIDNFVIRPASAAQCPEPGEVLNEAARPNDGGWRFASEGDAEAGFGPDVGRDATSGARLFRDADATGRAAMRTKVSIPIPQSVPSPALVFWWKGSADRLFEASIGTFVDFDDRGRQVGTLIGSNAGLNSIYCLPPWTHGGVLDLSFSLTGGEGSVAEELVVDDLGIVSDADCGAEAELLDPGFESAPNRWMGSSLGSEDADVVMQADGALSRSGTGTLELTYWTSDADLGMESYVLVPHSDAAQGPALRFYSRSPAQPSIPVRWLLGQAEVASGDVQTSSEWRVNEVCLPPEWAGRWFRVQVKVEPPDAAGGAIEQERVFLDDFALATTSACPTKR